MPTNHGLPYEQMIARFLTVIWLLFFRLFHRPNDPHRRSSAFGDHGRQEIDWSMGELFNALKQEGIDENTLVLFMGVQKEGSPRTQGTHRRGGPQFAGPTK